MEKITQEQRNLFNPYKNVSLIFKKKLDKNNNPYVSFNSEIRFDENDFAEENFKQSMHIEINGMNNEPISHRNEIHPLANAVMQYCNLNLVVLSGEDEWASNNPQCMGITKKDNLYSASLYTKVKNIYLNAILTSINQSNELSIKVDLLCDDSEFSRLENEQHIQVIVHGLSMSFNLPSI